MERECRRNDGRERGGEGEGRSTKLKVSGLNMKVSVW